MLEIRPNCELCNCDLPADSEQARICSYECTFCANCVDDPLDNVCPNCGGGFEARPVRPVSEWREGVSRQHQQVSETRVQKSVDADEHALFAAQIGVTPPWAR